MAIVDPTIERLSHQAPDLGMSVEDLDRIAALAYRITRVQQERSGIPVEPIHARAYEERTSQERAANRAGVLRVIQALVLLGWIERPTLEVP